MTRLFQPLWLLLASTADTKLAPVVEYLQAENRILRARLPDQIAVTPRERERLIRYGSVLGAALASVITIVSYRTFRRWVTEPDEGGVSKRRSDRKPGRPRTEDEVRVLVVRLARENSWGYTRVLGELKKLGITTVSRTTVANILRAEGLEPGPRRGPGTWSEFVRRHAATLWASDFVSVRTHTLGGVVDLYLLFFLHVGTRRVIVSAPTANPDDQGDGEHGDLRRAGGRRRTCGGHGTPGTRAGRGAGPAGRRGPGRTRNTCRGPGGAGR